MYQKFLFIFLFSFSILVGCKEAPVIYKDHYKDVVNPDEGQKDLPVSGILVSSNYIALKKTNEENVLTYNLSAVTLPENAKNTNLVYKIVGNSDVAGKATEKQDITVDEKGNLSINALGEYDVEIMSEENPTIKQVVKVSVTEGVKTPVSLENPATLYGKYVVNQYGVNNPPHLNMGRDNSFFEINVLQNKDDYKKLDVVSSLFLNGVKVDLLPENISSYENMSPEDIAKEIIKHANVTISNSNVIFSFKGSVFKSLVEAGIIKEDDTLNLSFVKVEDLIPNQQEILVTNINPTKVRPLVPYVSEDIKTVFDYDAKNGSQFFLNSAVQPSNASDKGIIYKSLDRKIATINSAGLVKVLKSGKVAFELRSKANNSIKWYVNFNFTNSSTRVENVAINNKVTELSLGDEHSFKYTLTPANATNKDVWFYTNNKDILSVDPNGKVRAIGEGVGYVYLRSKDNFDKSDFVKVIVRDKNSFLDHKVTSVMNKPSKVFLKENETFQLELTAFPSYATNKNLIYTVEDNGTKVVSVDNKGLIKGLSVGETKIFISAESNKALKEEIAINVRDDQAQDVVINELVVKEQHNEHVYTGIDQLKVEVETVPALSTVTFKKKVDVFTTNHDILSVEKDEAASTNDKVAYNITPIGEGQATVVVESENGKRKEIQYNVYKKMNIQGQYKIVSATYTLGDKTVLLSPTDNTSKFESEFSFYVDNNGKKLIPSGRIQFTPKDLNTIGVFNNKRYVFIKDTIDFTPGDDNFIFTENKLGEKNIKIIDSKNVEYTFNDKDLKVVLKLEKATDNNVEIPNKQIYVTPIDMAKDLKSLEGYYQLTYSFQRSFDRDEGWLGRHKYYPLHTAEECNYNEIKKSRFFIPAINEQYDKNKDDPYGRCDDADATWIPIVGKSKLGWTNKGFKGDILVKVTDDKKINITFKDMKSGHNSYDKNNHFKLFYTNLNDISFNDSCQHDEGKTCIVQDKPVHNYDWSYDYQGKTASFFFSKISDTELDFEISTFNADHIRMFNKYKKVSDKVTLDNNGTAIELDRRAYNDKDPKDDTTPPPYPNDIMKVQALSEVSGSATDITN